MKLRVLRLLSTGLTAGLVMATLAAGVACSAGERALSSNFSGQNLLLITIDTLRPDRLGAYGFAAAATPRLDQLAREGVRFESCYSQVPLTLPSHSTLFTGRLPFSHGVRNNGVNELAPGEQTLAEVFSRQGYGTSAIVAAYVLLSRFGLAQGFGSYDDALGRDLLQGFKSELRADEVYRKFQNWLRGRREGKFFTWVHFYDPHLPYDPPADLRERFANDPYSGEVAAVDRAVGKIIDDLRTAGLLESTLVVITSDHGEAFGEHGEEGHSIFGYEQNLRVPLILYAPKKLRAGVVIEERVRLIDLMPTLLELYQLPVPTGIEGRSFVDLLNGKEREQPEDVYFESFAGQLEKNWAPVQGIVVGVRKYVSLPEPELYDLEADPGEKKNLFPGERRSVRELDQALRSLLLTAVAPSSAGERELDEEDVEQLTALGYLSPAAQRASKVLDPKRGIMIDRALGEIDTALNSGQSERAAAQLEQVVRENPDVKMPALYELRSRVATARGDGKAALQALEQGVERFPDFEQLALALASHLVEHGRPADAIRIATAQLERNSRFSQMLIVRGSAALAAGDLAQALADSERALALEPRNMALAVRVAELLGISGQPTEALERYEALAASGALDAMPDQYFKAAALSGQLGRTDAAEALFRRGLELEPKGIHYLTFSVLLARNRKLQEAVQAMEQALGAHGSELTPEQRQLGQAMLAQWQRGG